MTDLDRGFVKVRVSDMAPVRDLLAAACDVHRELNACYLPPAASAAVTSLGLALRGFGEAAPGTLVEAEQALADLPEVVPTEREARAAFLLTLADIHTELGRLTLGPAVLEQYERLGQAIRDLRDNIAAAKETP